MKKRAWLKFLILFGILFILAPIVLLALKVIVMTFLTFLILIFIGGSCIVIGKFLAIHFHFK